nr:E285 [uncultured bacterium]
MNGIKALAASLNDLHQQMVLAYTPIVQDIIQSGSQDVQEIEHTLDHLLTCAGHPQGLLLFKSLCRHYYGIDPAAAAQHVHFYREWYEDQESEVRRSG